jgi:hypothetical protein
LIAEWTVPEPFLKGLIRYRERKVRDSLCKPPLGICLCQAGGILIADVLMDVRIGHDFTEIGDCAVLFKLFVIKEQSPVSRILFVCKKTPEHDDLHGNKKKEEMSDGEFRLDRNIWFHGQRPPSG